MFYMRLLWGESEYYEECEIPCVASPKWRKVETHFCPKYLVFT